MKKRHFKVLLAKYYDTLKVPTEPLKVRAFDESESIEIAREYLRRWQIQDEFITGVELIREG